MDQQKDNEDEGEDSPLEVSDMFLETLTSSVENEIETRTKKLAQGTGKASEEKH